MIDALVLDPDIGPWPWCAEMIEDTRICHFRSNWGWQLIDTVLPLLPKLTKPGDLWIQNIGVWYNDPDSLRSDMNRFGQYYADHKSELPTLIWRQSSVQHFPLSSTGDFGGFWLPPHYPCKPIGGEMDSIVLDPQTGHLLTSRPDLHIVQQVSFTSTSMRIPEYWEALWMPLRQSCSAGYNALSLVPPSCPGISAIALSFDGLQDELEICCIVIESQCHILLPSAQVSVSRIYGVCFAPDALLMLEQA